VLRQFIRVVIAPKAMLGKEPVDRGPISSRGKKSKTHVAAGGRCRSGRPPFDGFLTEG